MKRIKLLLFLCLSVVCVSCSRFHNAPTDAKDARYVVISPIYNEIIWALGAQNQVVGIDLSTTYPAEVKSVQTVGYHRALSAEGILSLHPTAVIHDNNIGPPQVVQQLQQLNIPMKTFTSKNDSFDGKETLLTSYCKCQGLFSLTADWSESKLLRSDFQALVLPIRRPWIGLLKFLLSLFLRRR